MTEEITALSPDIESHFVSLSHKLNPLCVAADEFFSARCSTKACHFAALKKKREAVTQCCVPLHTTPHNAVWALMIKAHIVNVHNFDRKCDDYF